MNPCCCMRLQYGVIFISIINMTISGVFFVSSLLYGISLYFSTVNNHKTQHEQSMRTAWENDYILAASIIIVLLCFLFEFVISIVLFTGARRRNLKRCNFWYTITFLGLAIFIVRRIIGIIAKVAGQEDVDPLGDDALTEGIQLLCAVVFKGYELWLVFEFMEEIKGVNTTGQPFYLRDIENLLNENTEEHPDPNRKIQHPFNVQHHAVCVKCQQEAKKQCSLKQC